MKHVKIGDIEFSKAICGTNAFYGRSHYSEARDIEYRSRFDNERIMKMIECCVELGINTIESSANEKIQDMLSLLQSKNQNKLHLVGSTRIDETSVMKSHHQKLEFLIQNQTEICIIHAQYIDHAISGDAITGLDRMLDKIHAAGLLAGISTHEVSTIKLCEKKGYPIDTYLFPLNITGFVYPGYCGKETVQERVDLVRAITKPVILMKTLGAGRIPPDEGLQFVAENSKPNDLISFGFGAEAEITETLQYFEKYF